MKNQLPSQSFSSSSLVEGARVLRDQQVKSEPDSAAMEAELQDPSCLPSAVK
jgi:hypothetical protein